MKTRRLFVGIRLPKPVLDHVVAIQRRVRDALGLRRFRWVQPDRIHLTLTFLGDVDEREIGPANRSMQEACALSKPFELQIGGIGCFPNARSARVIWLGLDTASPALATLQSELVEALKPFAARHEDKPFHPHLTLARRREGGGVERRLREVRFVSEKGDGSGGKTWTVDAVELIHSVLDPEGPRYITLARHPLE